MGFDRQTFERICGGFDIGKVEPFNRMADSAAQVEADVGGIAGQDARGIAHRPDVVAKCHAGKVELDLSRGKALFLEDRSAELAIARYDIGTKDHAAHGRHFNLDPQIVRRAFNHYAGCIERDAGLIRGRTDALAGDDGPILCRDLIGRIAGNLGGTGHRQPRAQRRGEVHEVDAFGGDRGLATGGHAIAARAVAHLNLSVLIIKAHGLIRVKAVLADGNGRVGIEARGHAMDRAPGHVVQHATAAIAFEALGEGRDVDRHVDARGGIIKGDFFGAAGCGADEGVMGYGHTAAIGLSLRRGICHLKNHGRRIVERYGIRRSLAQAHIAECHAQTARVKRQLGCKLHIRDPQRVALTRDIAVKRSAIEGGDLLEMLPDILCREVRKGGAGKGNGPNENGTRQGGGQDGHRQNSYNSLGKHIPST